MGMLMHHTWLEQQEKKAKKPVKAEVNEPVAEAKEEEPVNKTPVKTGRGRKIK